MDPTACILAAQDARAKSAEAYKAHAYDYNNWIDKGGFPARIQLQPHTDAWMQGDRYADVIRLVFARDCEVKARLDKSGRVVCLTRGDFKLI